MPEERAELSGAEPKAGAAARPRRVQEPMEPISEQDLRIMAEAFAEAADPPPAPQR